LIKTIRLFVMTIPMRKYVILGMRRLLVAVLEDLERLCKEMTFTNALNVDGAYALLKSMSAEEGW